MPERIFDRAKFRARRRERNKTQGFIAEGIGVREAAVAKYESGETTPPPEKLPRLAGLVEMELDELAPRHGLPNLADLRCDAGYTQKDTPTIIGTSSPSPVRKAENGLRRLSELFEQPLASAYGVALQELRAAQERSFGNEVPAVVPDVPASAPVIRPDAAPPQTLADKITYLLEQTYTPSSQPTDNDLARAANKAAGRLLLNESLMQALRTGEQTKADDDVLDALAHAMDVPSVFFRSDDREVAQIVARIKNVRQDFGVMAARGGESGGVPPELMQFISDTFAGLLGEQAGQRSPGEDH
ncbi:helix-turn-helix domain-containing protein [[Kitasatospora] papulosa]|uniref:helix-turn-helix domain-containing protein n=1 Tax=[Kitasatospora] papulosa TaxID=1464011 RepID=UPI0036BFC72E